MPFLPPNQQRQSTEGNSTEVSLICRREPTTKKWREKTKNCKWIRKNIGKQHGWAIFSAAVMFFTTLYF